MLALVLGGVLCMIVHHLYYHHLDSKPPTLSLRRSSLCTWLENQTVVSDIGLALAYTAQTLFIAAVAISSSQLFWRSLRSRAHTVARIDALMKAQVNPFTPSSIRAARASFTVFLLALLATAMSAVSIFAPGSIQVSNNMDLSKECSVNTLRDLTSLTTDRSSDYSSPLGTVLSLSSFIPPLNACESGMQCRYDLEFVGPGYDCQDVTASSDYAAFAKPTFVPGTGNVTNVYNASFMPHTADLTIRLFVQTWDIVRSQFQAVNCTGVSRSYSVTVMHNTSSSAINVHDSRLISPILSQPGVDPTPPPGNGNISFTQDYMIGGMTILMGTININALAVMTDSDVQSFMTGALGNTNINGLGSLLPDGNMTWRENMTVALEEYAQNLTLSLLSGQISPFNNTEEPSLLENSTTACIYTLTAYEYSPYRLFLTYGIAAFVTLLCVAWGTIAIQLNGVDESMDFTRLLRAVLNEKMYHWYEGEGFELDMNARIKADDTSEGALAPVIDRDSDLPDEMDALPVEHSTFAIQSA